MKRYDLYEEDHKLLEGENGRYYLVSEVEREMIPRPTLSEVMKALYAYESAVERRTTAYERGDCKAVNEWREDVVMARLALFRLMGVEVMK